MPAARASRGEVWLTDLGLAAKQRPVLILGLPGSDDRQIFTYVPHTTSAYGTDFEVTIKCAFLKDGVFDAQGISTVPCVKPQKRLGTLSTDQLAMVEDAVLTWLEIE